MATLVLVRHGRTQANATGVLAGRTPGVRLDDLGTQQATAAAERLSVVPLAEIVTSPLVRTRQTAAALAAAQQRAHGRDTVVRRDRRLLEADYGAWQGRPLKELAKEDLWRTVVGQPSAAAFPDGESMLAMSQRAVESVREHDARIAAEHGSGAVWAAVSHGDLIKAILADALGQHLDLFQRIQVDPASLSIVRYDAHGPRVLAMNTHAGDLSWLRPPTKTRRRRSRAAAGGPEVGGGAGPDAPPSDPPSDPPSNPAGQSA